MQKSARDEQPPGGAGWWREWPWAWEDVDDVWAPLFNPKDYEQPHISQDVADYILPVDELEELGKQVVQLREHVK